MNRVVSRFGFLFLFAIACSMTGCLGYVGGVPVAEVQDVETYYDDPVQGWYVNGYWTGGCLNCGYWVAPFWTRDVVVLHEHWGYYHGAHYNHLARHFERFGGAGHYNHQAYLQQREQRRQVRHEERQERREQRQQQVQQRHEERQERRAQRQERQSQPREPRAQPQHQHKNKNK